MFFSKPSQLIKRNYKKFQNKNVFFSGNIQDIYPCFLSTIKKKIYIQKYHHWVNFKKNNNSQIVNIHDNFLANAHITKEYNTLIYYWPKNKDEAIFQLINLLSVFSINSEIFIVGKNTSGIKSASKMLNKWIKLITIDQAKHSILLFGILTRPPNFLLDTFFSVNNWKNISIKSLPGVFGYKKIDDGSKFLVSTFSKNIEGRVLDMGCGSGFLSVALAKKSPNTILTLADTNTSAIISSRATLECNNVQGKVILSDVYDNIVQKFDIILSNPPFHDDLQINFDITKKIISHSVKYLKKRGELRFVTNRFLNYTFFLNHIFKKYYLLKENKKYKVYQAFLN